MFETKKTDMLNEIEEMQKNYEDYMENHSIDKLLETSKIVQQYLKARNTEKRDLLLKIIDRVEIHSDKTVDVYFKLKALSVVN